MSFYDVQKRQSKELGAGVSTRTFWGENMLVSLVEIDAHSEVPAHSHPHEQAGIVIQGELEMWIGPKRRLLKEGGCFIVPPGIEHRVTTSVSSCKVADIFSPVREEYKY